VPLLLILLGLGVLAYLWWRWRRTTLTRECRWRLDRTKGAGHWRCAACGAVADLAPGEEPKRCLGPRLR
jgi:LSD1 subclass zinc finger protein